MIIEIQDIYDTNLFMQELRRRSSFNQITQEDVIDAFWLAANQLKESVNSRVRDFNWSALNDELTRSWIPLIIISIERNTNLRIIKKTIQ